MSTYYGRTSSPVGPLLLTASERGLTGVYMSRDRHAPAARPDLEFDAARFAGIMRQLDEYFARARKSFDVALDIQGTPFQRTVWQALSEIPYGETISYGELARRIGKPKAVRAVGQANNRNPVCLIVPCHRVIGSDGSLTGYGGGIENKRFLLALEAG